MPGDQITVTVFTLFIWYLYFVSRRIRWRWLYCCCYCSCCCCCLAVDISSHFYIFIYECFSSPGLKRCIQQCVALISLWRFFLLRILNTTSPAERFSQHFHQQLTQQHWMKWFGIPVVARRGRNHTKNITSILCTHASMDTICCVLPLYACACDQRPPQTWFLWARRPTNGIGV